MRDHPGKPGQSRWATPGAGRHQGRARDRPWQGNKAVSREFPAVSGTIRGSRTQEWVTARL
ncbi:hypothetical protein Srubr_61270 [Streptomyces rubradiris]|uniref:Uncharacterized protein n=1 Tax=Streptomyces rubradiris TaxID=285531 RepID=A0ABQ3RKB4_STRRR|nr:hypothetical protein GCM10018792_61880 [Streptomyces rubradiris]GHI56281.1 hypothetical protein Srubr_61270 [Streptomyces rubradiris]